MTSAEDHGIHGCFMMFPKMEYLNHPFFIDFIGIFRVFHAIKIHKPSI